MIGRDGELSRLRRLVLPPPTEAANGPDGKPVQDPKKKKGLFGKIAGIFKDDKSSAPVSKPADSGQPPPQ